MYRKQKPTVQQTRVHRGATKLRVLNDTFSDGLLKHPQYTRPESSKYGEVPKVLLSGDHELIRKWQLKQSLLKTKENRPDLLKDRRSNAEEESLLEEIISEEKS